MKNENENDKAGEAHKARHLERPAQDRMMRRASTADILPRNLLVPGSRPKLVESDDQ